MAEMYALSSTDRFISVMISVGGGGGPNTHLLLSPVQLVASLQGPPGPPPCKYISMDIAHEVTVVESLVWNRLAKAAFVYLSDHYLGYQYGPGDQKNSTFLCCAWSHCIVLVA